MSLIGIGYDSHRLVPGRKLIVGGVELDSDVGLEGHSDADVLAHAVIDALLGAAGLGDIGVYFPDSDERYREANSIALLRTALASVHEAGFTLVNVDCTLVMERPKLGANRERIRTRLADTLTLPHARVNVKASTGEGIGFVGRGEGVAAIAIAMLDGAGTSAG